MCKRTSTSLGAIVGTAIAASVVISPVVNADQNPFSVAELQQGYQVAAGHLEGGCGEGRCGEDKTKKEGKCGEGSCGEDKAKNSDCDDKEKEGKCGEDKAKEEGKCGEGKCGEGKASE